MSIKDATQWTLRTHLPYHLLSQNPKAKYLWIVRNPKDVCVSYYYHCIQIGSKYENMSFSEYFQHWINGEVSYGSYFDHVLSWWSHKDDANVTWMVYETYENILRKLSIIGSISR